MNLTEKDKERLTGIVHNLLETIRLVEDTAVILRMSVVEDPLTPPSNEDADVALRTRDRVQRVLSDTLCFIAGQERTEETLSTIGQDLLLMSVGNRADAAAARELVDRFCAFRDPITELGELAG